MKVNCHVTKKRKINNQTTSESVTIINAANENFVMHRRLMLTIVIKIDDRKESENFIAADEAKKANEKKINKVTVMNEAAEKKENVAIAKFEYLTKTFSTTLIIMIFNS